MTLNSSISSSRRPSALLRFLGKLGILILLAWGIDALFMLFFYPADAPVAEANRRKMHQMEQLGENDWRAFDAFIIGSSHAQFGFDAGLFSSMTKIPTYNAGVGGYINAWYHLQVVERFTEKTAPRHLIYALDSFALNDRLQDRSWLAGDYSTNLRQISHAARHDISVRRYIQEIPVEGWTLPLFRPPRYNPKQMSAFKSYSGHTLHNSGWVEMNALGWITTPKRGHMAFAPTPSSLDYLHRIIKLCKKHQTKITLTVIPVTLVEYQGGEKRFQDYYDFINKLAAQEGISLINLNHPDRFPMERQELFYDADHLNAQGAQHFTTLFARAFLANP